MRYRIAIRHGHPRPQYLVTDVEAPSLRDALLRAADAVPPEAAATADLAEIRRQTEPDERTYAPD